MIHQGILIMCEWCKPYSKLRKNLYLNSLNCEDGLKPGYSLKVYVIKNKFYALCNEYQLFFKV